MSKLNQWREKVHLFHSLGPVDNNFIPSNAEYNGDGFKQAAERLQLRIKSNMDDLRSFIACTRKNGNLSDIIEKQGIDARNKFENMKNQLGMSFKPAQGNIGLQVTKIDHQQSADIGGIIVGDIIMMAENMKTICNDDLLTVIRGTRPGDSIQFQIKRIHENENHEYDHITINVIVGAVNYTIEEVKAVRLAIKKLVQLEQSDSPLPLAPEYAGIVSSAQKALDDLEDDYNAISQKLFTLQKAMSRRSFVSSGVLSLDYHQQLQRSKPIIMLPSAPSTSTLREHSFSMPTDSILEGYSTPENSQSDSYTDSEDQEEPEETQAMEDKICNRLFDYFFSLEIITEAEADVTGESSDSFRKCRYPATDYKDFSLPDERHITHYALLTGNHKTVIQFDDKGDKVDAEQIKLRIAVSQTHYFTYTITDQVGDKCYVSCVLYYTPRLGSNQIYGAKCLCLLSHYPFYNLFYCCLQQLKEMDGKAFELTDQSSDQILQFLLREVPLPSCGGAAVQFPLGNFQLTCFRPSLQEFPLLDLDLRLLFRWLSADNVVSIVAHILTENKLLFHSVDLYKLSVVIPSFLALIFPFRWQAPMICEPLISASQVAVLDAPVTYIIGSHSDHVQGGEIELSETIIVNLDNNTVKYPPQPFQQMSFPGQKSSIIAKQIKNIVKNQHATDVEESYKKRRGLQRKEITFTPKLFGFKWVSNIITFVNPGEQADRAGLQIGWRIFSVNGEVCGDIASNIREMINASKAKGKNTVIVFIQGQAIKKVFAPRKIGFAWKGNRVTDVVADSQASEAGVKIGWCILMVNAKIQKKDGTDIQSSILETFNQGKDTEIIFAPRTYVRITATSGCGIRLKPTYPGTRTGEIIMFNEVVEYTERKIFDYSAYRITFYKLANLEGWVHDYSPENPGIEFSAHMVDEDIGNGKVEHMLKRKSKVKHTFNVRIRAIFFDLYRFLLEDYRKCMFFLDDVPVFNAEVFFELHRSRKSQALGEDKLTLEGSSSLKFSRKSLYKSRSKKISQRKSFLVRLLETQLFACFLQQSHYPSFFHKIISNRNIKTKAKISNPNTEHTDQIRMTPDEPRPPLFEVSLTEPLHQPNKSERKELYVCNWLDISNDTIEPRDLTSIYLAENKDTCTYTQRPKSITSGTEGEDLHSFIYFIILSSFKPNKKTKQVLERKRNICLRTLSRKKSRRYLAALFNQTATEQTAKKIPLKELQFGYLKELVRFHLDQCEKRYDFTNAVPILVAGTQFYCIPKKSKKGSISDGISPLYVSDSRTGSHSRSSRLSISRESHSPEPSISLYDQSSLSSPTAMDQYQMPNMLDVSSDREVYLEAAINKHSIFKLREFWDKVFELRLAKLKDRDKTSMDVEYILINDLLSSLINTMITYGQDEETVINFCHNKSQQLNLSPEQSSELKALAQKIVLLSNYSNNDI